MFIQYNDKNKIFELTGIVYGDNRYYQLNNKILGKDIYVEFCDLPYDNFKVSVKLEVNEEILKSDPAFVNSWDLVANTDGNILIKGKRFRYLFYENTLNEPVEMEDNYWVISKNRVDLLKVLFVSLGLNERESQDFYDYVESELGKTGANYFKVSRVSYDYLQKNMVLNISPKPDNLIRIILVFQPFNVVEWGTIIDNRLMK